MQKTSALALVLIGLNALTVLVTSQPAAQVEAARPTPTPLPQSVVQPPGRSNPICRAKPAFCRDDTRPHRTTVATAIYKPAVTFTNPALDARGVTTHTLISASFNDTMNPSTINSGTFFVMQGTTPVAGSISYNAVSRIAIFTPGAPLALNTIYTATLTTSVQNMSAVPLASDFVWAFTTSDGVSPLGNGMNIYFGDLHSHSSYSDGQGTPADAFATARANGADFFALTDHAESLTSLEWQDMLNQANAATSDGRFVGLRGFEFSHANGHINVFDTDTYVQASDPNYSTLNQFYAWLANQSTAIGQFNHPRKTETYDWNFNDFAFNAPASAKMVLRETPGYPADQYLLSLNAGWRIGAVDNSDTHSADWGRGRYMGIVAAGLSKNQVLEAFRARRTFSISEGNLALVMQANGNWMGSVIPYAQTINFTITAYDPDPIEPILALVLYDNGEPVASTTLLSKPTLYTWNPSITGSSNHYYYTKAYLDADGWVVGYTSPVWMEQAPGSVQLFPIILKNVTSP